MAHRAGVIACLPRGERNVADVISFTFAAHAIFRGSLWGQCLAGGTTGKRRERWSWQGAEIPIRLPVGKVTALPLFIDFSTDRIGISLSLCLSSTVRTYRTVQLFRFTGRITLLLLLNLLPRNVEFNASRSSLQVALKLRSEGKSSAKFQVSIPSNWTPANENYIIDNNVSIF